MSSAAVAALQTLPLSKIRPSPRQPRRDFNPEALRELAQSMKEEGLIEPVVVRPLKTGYELIAGERRFRAARMLGWKGIEAKILPVQSDEEAALKSLIENLQREDLNSVEEAEGFAALQRMDKKTWTGRRIAQALGKSETYVSRSLSLLELPEAVRRSLRYRKLSRDHAIELLRLPRADQRSEVARQIPGRLTVEETRKLVNDLLAGKTKIKQRPKAEEPEKDPLAEVWLRAMANPAIAPQGTWSAQYQGGLTWLFRVHAASFKAEEYLAGWFGGLSLALRGAEPSLPEAARRLKEAQKKTRREEARLPQPQKSDLLQNARFPKDAKEMAEVEAAAQSGGPAAVYQWVYGPSSALAKLMSGQSWKDLGLDGDPARAARQLLDLIRTSRPRRGES